MATEIAIDGYDPVAYFDQGRPSPGSMDFSFEYSGKTWLFSSVENRERFVSSPDSFVPQYGGYCSWAMAKGNRVKVDPNCWAVVDGKLYLNYSKRIHRRWLKRMEKLIPRANVHWREQKA